MATRKIRPHPGALTKLLKQQNMTQTDAANTSGIDRKTLSKIDRGEDVKEETLQKLAKKLNVPATHFEPPASNSDGEASQPDDPQYLHLMLRNVGSDRLAEMLAATENIRWKLNVRTVDDDAIQLLEQLEDAVNELHAHLMINSSEPSPDDDHSLRCELVELKKTMQISKLFEELTNHRLAIIGAEYLHWHSVKKTRWHDEILYTDIEYTSYRCVVLSIEPHPAQARRVKVWQGSVPPKLATDFQNEIWVNGVKLETDPDAEIPF